MTYEMYKCHALILCIYKSNLEHHTLKHLNINCQVETKWLITVCYFKGVYIYIYMYIKH